ASLSAVPNVTAIVIAPCFINKDMWRFPIFRWPTHYLGGPSSSDFLDIAALGHMLLNSTASAPRPSANCPPPVLALRWHYAIRGRGWLLPWSARRCASGWSRQSSGFLMACVSWLVYGT